VIVRLREIAGRPLEPAIARGLVVLAGAVCVGFAVLVGLGLLGPAGAGWSGPGSIRSRVAGAREAARRPASIGDLEASPRSRIDHAAQDPQDRPGTPAARRARRELATHRALQHVPWRRGGVSILLVGAHHGKAVLSVAGPTRVADRRGWRSFLRLFQDDGRSYVPRLRVEKEVRP
jgi:hypothetical protein